MSDKTLQFTLRGLFAGSLILLGLVMWCASLWLPAVSDGTEGAAHTGWACLVLSIMHTFGGGKWGGWSTLVSLLHLLLLGALFLQITHPWPRWRWRRVLATLLVAGALLLELGLSREFEATYRGFHLWCMSFLVVGVGLWVQLIGSERAP